MRMHFDKNKFENWKQPKYLITAEENALKEAEDVNINKEKINKCVIFEEDVRLLIEYL